MELKEKVKTSGRSTCFTAQEVRDLEFVYRIFDVNGADVLGGEEVRKALQLLAFKVSRKTVQHLLQDLQQITPSPQASSRQRNCANFEGFLEIVAKLQGFSFDQHEELVQAFKYIDGDSDGLVTQADLCRYAPKVGLTSSDVKDMLAEADKDGDGKINQKEFLSIMKQTNLFSK